VKLQFFVMGNEILNLVYSLLWIKLMVKYVAI
jgi:hypothetical protein